MKEIIGEIIPFEVGSEKLSYTEHIDNHILVKYKTDKQLLGANQKQNLTTEINLLSSLIANLFDEFEDVE